MARRSSAAFIEDAATLWVAQLDRGLSPAEQAALDEWIAADTRHLGALARAQALWQEGGRAQIFKSTALNTEVSPAVTPKRAFARWAALAAGVAILVSGASYIWAVYVSTHWSTGIGEIRHLPLADGSSITLNTRSEVKVAYSSDARIVRLDQGEALFSVTPDVNRPFVVEAGMIRVRAIGTEFVVRREGDTHAQVIVTRGAVDVWRDMASPEPSTRITAGRRTVATPEAIETPKSISEAEMARSVAWQNGIIDLDGRTLAEAASEFNRYNKIAVVISDPALASRKVVGRFNTSDPQGFATAAAAMLDARVRRDAERITIERRSPQ